MSNNDGGEGKHFSITFPSSAGGAGVIEIWLEGMHAACRFVFWGLGYGYIGSLAMLLRECIAAIK